MVESNKEKIRTAAESVVKIASVVGEEDPSMRRTVSALPA
jgi:hypothetical protein